MEGQQEHPPPIDASKLNPASSAPPWGSAAEAPATGSPAAADAAGGGDDAFAQRPELYVGAAFAGGVVLAGVLRLLGR